jgi:sulfate adenylyltransferase
LGFSKEHRDLNITRIGFVASEITKNGGIAICAPIAPYKDSREQNRKLISDYGNYVEIFISTPLSTCERRDTKGLYAMARQGKIKGFTGIDDPYEAPENPCLEIDTTDITEEEAIQKVMLFLEKEGYLV